MQMTRNCSSRLHQEMIWRRETSAITAMESCIAGISQCLLTGMRQQIQKVSDISTILVGDSQIVPSYPLSITFITRVELGNI